MKTSIFIANIVSAILILNFLVVNPSITGLVVAEPGTKINLSGPLGFSIVFTIVVIALDIYFYLKGKRD